MLTAAVRLDDPLVPTLRHLGSAIGPNCGESAARHIAIEAENYLALRLLGHLYAGQVDCIYIDPPYNSGATDWKYNNRFVDASDRYRHSKWLSMMQRRLNLAARLLRPDGVLIITIDENEVHHLGVLLEQQFPTATHQMVTVVIMPAGSDRGTFARVEEHALFAFFGTEPSVCESGDDLLSGDASRGNEPPEAKKVRWSSLLRSGNNNRPQDRPGLVYPVWVDPSTGRVVGTGRTLAERRDAGEAGSDPASLDGFEPPDEPPIRPGAVAVWPRNEDRALACWRQSPSTLMEKADNGFAYASRSRGDWAFSYLSGEQIAQIGRGELTVTGRDPTTGAVEIAPRVQAKRPRTVWHRTRHDAGQHGTTLLKRLLGEKRFDFPKSLYSTLDAVASVVADRPDALVVDFFAGSGTTLHAVAALNAADGGGRRCVLVSNNELSAADVKSLRSQGLRPGESEWDHKGIFQHVLMPRVTAAVTGLRPDGRPVEGRYLPPLFDRPFSDGLAAGVEFFALGTADSRQAADGDRFDAVHPLLWAAAGAHGPCPPEPLSGVADLRHHVPGWLLPDDGAIPSGCRYGVLLRPSRLWGFADALAAHSEIEHVWTAAADRDEVPLCRRMPTAGPSRHPSRMAVRGPVPPLRRKRSTSMKIELAAFQHNAAEQMIDHLQRAQREVCENPVAGQAVCLSAPTGAGKTVMMARVIEEMLKGDIFAFREDGPAVLWITDSPELNEQSRLRLSSHVDTSWNDRIETIENSFDMPTLPPGVWFLNTQKLGEKALLANPGDRRSHTFWQTVAATVERRPGDLILVVDEAHRGMSLSNRDQKESRSIIQRFIRGHRIAGGNGSGVVFPGVPLLVGVSATPKRFHDLLADLQPPRTLRRVDVSVQEVRSSGLLKQTIRLRHVGGRPEASYTLLREALQQYRQFASEWKQRSDDVDNGVDPVLLVQVEDAGKGTGSASRTDLDAVISEIVVSLGDDLRKGGLAHAFQEPAGPLTAAGTLVRRLRPSEINGDEHVQVVLFKTALSTGWDCPRAEVMMSFRSARDETAIAQLIGRMVRAPLRREIPGSELLNGVDLYLPKFDSEALDKVVTRLSDEDSDEQTPAQTYVARDLSINPDVAPFIKEIRAALEEVPTFEPAPRRNVSDVRRLADIARKFERAATGAPPVLEDASEIAREELVAKIVKMHQRNEDDLRATAKGILAVEQSTVVMHIDPEQPADASEDGSDPQALQVSGQDLDRQFDDLNKTLGNGLLRYSLKRLESAEPLNDRRHRLQAELLALFRADSIGADESVQTHAREQIEQWQTEHSSSINALPDDERHELMQLFAESGKATLRQGDLGAALPEVITARKPPENAVDLERHIYTDNGESKVRLPLNRWEQKTVEMRLTDTSVVAWLRNERSSGRWRLAIPYQIHDEEALMYPDLVFFRRDSGTLKVDIVDPHSLHLDDALEKLQGLANYAKQNRDHQVLGQVVAVAEVDRKRYERDLSDHHTAQKALDCTEASIRNFFTESAGQMSQTSYEPPVKDRDDIPARPTRRRRLSNY